ncbi:MAG: GntR family transcriptional regulator [Acidobacteriia bacterium]|nr:GntR family transcriptional regulator [Terriglobia bacterium]
MEFILDAHSTLPPHLQLQEQIKLALLLGRLRPGDTLPSIRDVEKQTRLSRNIVRKAYLGLQRSGILSLRHGKGVLVEKDLSYSERGSIMEQCESLSTEILSRVERLGITPSAFARYLYQQARERERTLPSLVFVDASESTARQRAAKISSYWHVNVPGLSMDELAALQSSGLKGIRTILTNYLRLDQVRQIVGRDRADVIPLSLVFTPEMREQFRKLPANANVVLVVDDRDHPSLTLILESYRKILVESSVKMVAIRKSEIPDLEKFVRSGKYQLVIFSNRIWNQVPDKVKKLPRVTRPLMDMDLSSLESVRIRAGVVL